MMDYLKMQRSLNLKDQVFLVLFAIIPILGSLSLGLILCFMIFLSVYHLFKEKEHPPLILFKKIGIIFLLYFLYYSIHGSFFTINFSQHIHDLGKILPIFIIGIFALTLQKNTFSLSYSNISNAAVWAIYLTTALAFIFLYFQPDVSIFGEKLVFKTGVIGRLEMGTGNALPFATIFITLAFMTCLSMDKKSLLEKALSYLALIIALVVVILWNGSRGPILVLIPILPLLLWYLTKLSPRKKKWFYPLFGLSGFLIVGLLIWILHIFNLNNTAGHAQGYSVVSNMINGIKQLFLDGKFDGSVGIRLVLYSASIKAFISEPLLGFGIGNIYDAVRNFLPIGKSYNYSHLHNMFLNHIVAGGVLGLPFLFALVFSPLIILKTKGHKVSNEAIYIGLLIIFVIFGTGMSNVLFFHDLLAGFFSTLILLSAIALCNDQTTATRSTD